jgi:N-acyl-D-amino-acid deacylase
MPLRRWILIALVPTLLAGALCWYALGQREAAQPAQPDQPAQPVTKGPGGLPISGRGEEILAPVDEALEAIMLRHGVPGAGVAITKDGRLVYAKGLGWSNFEKKTLSTVDTLYGLASVSKVFTALAILKLVEEGKLKLDDKAFDFFKEMKLPPGTLVVDPRLGQITIRQLLNHTGGWDRNKSGDPINWAFQISLRLGVPMPITEEQLIRFMLGVRLDFDPGTRAEYSNFGFIVLGQIIGRVSGQSYEDYVRAKVLRPMGITAPRLHDHEGKYFVGEARRYNPGLFQAMEPYNLPWTDASGGWAASAVDLAKLLTALEGSRTGKPFLREDLMKEMVTPPGAPVQPRADGTFFGLGWDMVAVTPQGAGYSKGGSWPGIRSQIKHRLDGINTILLCNTTPQVDPIDMKIAGDALREIQEHLSQLKEVPKYDLFGEFR